MVDFDRFFYLTNFGDFIRVIQLDLNKMMRISYSLTRTFSLIFDLDIQHC
jgi:hypothetical protein